MGNVIANYLSKSKTSVILSLGSLCCILLLMIRIYVTQDLHYAFLVWNLFLAWIPFWLTDTMQRLYYSGGKLAFLFGVFGVWLLFFPNAPYILTDLFHLRPKQHMPLWFDLILIVSFAWNGMILGFVSLLRVQKILADLFRPLVQWLVVIIILILSAFGIYLGRYDRLNSWDIIADPFSLFGNIIMKIIDPLAHPRMIGVTLFFSLFLIVSYLTLYFLIRSKEHEY